MSDARISVVANVFGGVITYGGLDSEHCGGVIAYEKLTVARYWQFKVKKVTAGSFSSTRGWQVISSTGSTFIYAPTAIAAEIAKAVNAEYDKENAIYRIDCGEKPNIVFEIGNHNYNIEAINLVREVEENMCVFNVYPDSSLGYSPSWILGVPFIRQYCHIHDMGKKLIGFAKSLQN
ncbi:eukaryotic aspartyl protease [Ancylostoma caninum]|uniref:Eukaryotic aspartyl protease n=1 Tax=Ancylostoma caninum TaxID=29170 RepID=A0A368GP35_ANCCA|nr:eukaryotic aspartyl protease [Ancylostoma caninum]